MRPLLRLILLWPAALWLFSTGTVSAVVGETRVLTGHVPAAITRLAPIGKMAASQRLNLAIGLPLRHQVTLSGFLAELYNPASPRYRHYLTTEQFTALFGPTEEEYQAVAAFAQKHGLVVTATHPNRMILDVSGTVRDIEGAFHVRLREYQHPAEHRTFFAPDSEPQVEASLPVLHVSGLNNYLLPHPANLKRLPLDQGGHPRPLGGSGPSGSYRGSDFRAAYARGVTLTGTGQMVGLLQFDGFYPSDIASYESQASLPNVPVQTVLLDDFNGAAGTNNIEVALDIELTISMAPGLAAVLVYEGAIPNDILSRMATDNLAKQLSASWTFDVDATTAQIFQQFAAQGQSYFNASGDAGAFGSTVPPPSDSPYITVVGGTTLTTSSPAGPWVSETVWNWGSGGASGGGISPTNSIPIWQQTLNMSANGGSTTMRNSPDVAMVADNVYVISDNGKSGFVGGTSCAAPLWAAFTALVNQQAVSLGQSTVGFLNPTIYTLGQSAGYSTNFHDITTGNNTTSSNPNQFFATAGYDLCTGWGSPIGANLINSLAPRQNARVLVPAGSTLVSEGCLPANGAVDPGETVTVNFSLKNIGAVKTTNLVATLLSDSGVLAPSNPQTFGSLTGGGSSVSRQFTFTANGNCGGTVTVSLQLQDGQSDLGTAAFSFALGKPTVTLTQNFDGVTVPSLPAGWTTTASGSASRWVSSTGARDSSPNSVYAAESPATGVGELVSPAIPITSSNAVLSFRNNYNTEADPVIVDRGYDGGVLEIKIGNAGFLDILDAGGSFVSGGYTRTLDATNDNPLAGRQAWSGLSAGFLTTAVTLPPSAAGQNVQFKWRFGTDTGNFYGGLGWYIDSISVQDGISCCSSIADLGVSQAAAPDPAFLGQPLTYTIGVTNSGPEPSYNVVLVDTLPATVAFVSASPGCIYTNGTVTCALGTLPSASLSGIAVTVTPLTADPLTNVVSVSSVTSDTNSPNNQSIVITSVSAEAPPLITTQPQDLVTLPGTSAVFQVVASGAAPLSYQWFFNGTNALGTSDTLTITNVQLAHMGNYTVVVSNSVGTTTSRVAHLILLVPPSVQLTSAGGPGTGVSLQIQSLSGLTYTLEYKNSLTDSNWIPISPDVPGTGGALVLLDPAATAQPTRFYRVNVH